MDKLWAGRQSKRLNELAEEFNSSLKIDCLMYKQDILGSLVHAQMLEKQGIITKEDNELIQEGLKNILADLETGKLKFDNESEDIHSFVENQLTQKIGEAGKRLHTARSRNDQVALDIRLYLRQEAEQSLELISELIKTLLDIAQKHSKTIMPGYTHMQKAQPISFAHHIMAYAFMFLRDKSRLEQAKDRMNYSPLGSCALAGTGYNIDRYYIANALGFDGIMENSIDGVSDRDFCIDFCSAIATCLMHLSRFSEEIILWSSWEFNFIEIDDSSTTGSSIMPQKKNPDIAELVRGKSGRVFGNLMAILTLLKGLPLAYNKDMQEDKEIVFDSFNTLKACIKVFIPMLKDIRVKKENMKNALKTGYLNATDLADYLCTKGIAFRQAYKITGQIVQACIEKNICLEDMTLKQYKEFHPYFEQDLYSAIDMQNCLNKRNSAGGPAEQSLLKQIEIVKGAL